MAIQRSIFLVNNLSKRLAFALFVFSCMVTTTVFAVPAIEEYGRLPAVSNMRISPSGNLLAFRKTANDKDYLVVFDLKQQKILHSVDLSAIDPRHFYFLDEKNLVLIVSDYMRIQGYRGMHNMSSAYRIQIDKGDVDQLLTPGYKIYLGQLGLGRVVGLNKSRTHVYMPAFIGEPHVETPPMALMRVNIKSPRKIKAVYTGRNHTVDFFIGPDGEPIAEERYNDRNNLHQVLARHGKSWEVIYEREVEIRTASFAGITADGKHLVMLQEDSKTKRNNYYLMSLADGSLSRTNFGRPDRDVEELYEDVNRVVYGVRYSGFNPSYSFFDSKIDTFVASLLAKFPEHSVWLSSWSKGWDKVTFKVEGSQYAEDYFVADRSGKIDYITTARPNIDVADINPIGTFQYTASDGLKIPALLTIPRDKIQGMRNLPAVLLPHGGPESYDRIGFDFLPQVLASRGYLVVQPQFRGSDGFGGDFVRAGYGEWGKKMQTDLSDAVAVLSKKGMLDPERVCIVGWSYGGYAALAGGAFSPELYKCVVSINGVSDLPKMMRSERRDMGRDSWVLSYWSLAMANGDASNEKLKSISPAYFADQFKAPVLLIHGERDKVVPMQQSKVMHSRLKKAGKEVQLIVANDDSHGLIDGENRVKAVKAVVEFVDQNIGR
ncbi:alpha/beta fold hydrolase [Teredinibacter turnerae]|uniref:alpha/beta hydrolase family protein n=1 Tax=Teredinibacter turnerae TaxID=2426 RepID=UPI0003699309|nr:alpha/beta fold hydrolase [Teredinibacter turnerae]